MSTLNVSNITDGTTTVGTSYVVNGSAKAWVNMVNGRSTLAIGNSLNCSSLTDVTTGMFQGNWASSMSGSDYVSGGTCNNQGYSYSFNTGAGAGSKTASSTKTYWVHHSGAVYDLDDADIIVNGDLA
jgi:hypothetical protein